MKTINVTVRDKIASAVGDIVYICGNSDYIINFDFDAEWDAYGVKTARFVHNGTYTDVVFTGDQCAMPVIHKAYGIYVGVYAGDLHTTTPAHIPSAASILSAEGTPAAPPDDVYAQITALCNEAVSAATSVRKDADAGKFDGAPGKSAYQYAEEGGYTGTETEFAEKLASGDNFYIDLAGSYPAYTCPMPMDDIKAAYNAGYNLVCRCTFNVFTATLPLVIPEPDTNFWVFSVFGATTSFTVIITEGSVSAQLAEFATIYDRLPNPQSLTFTGAAEGTYDGSESLTVEIPGGDSIVPAPSSADNGKFLGCENGAAKWKPVEASGGGDISLGLSSASVGQTIKVKAVDENGKPTEWEAAKEKTLKWVTVHSSTLTEEATSFSVSADENGKPITDYNPLGIAVALYIPADSTQADDNGQLWVYPQSKAGDNAIRVIGTISGWKTIIRDAMWMWQGGDILGFTGNNNGAAPVYRVSDYVMDGVYALVRGNGNHLPVGTKALVTILCEV